MTTKLAKYGIMIIAAVLLMTVAFAGAASATINTISIGPIGNGSLSTNPMDVQTGGHPVYIIPSPNPGYHLADKTNLKVKYYNGYIYSDVTVHDDSGYYFIMPYDYDVTVTANFLANVTTVKFYKESGDQFGSDCVNTFGTSTVMPITTPTKKGYTFVGWNVSDGGWKDFNSASFNDDGTWKYTGSASTLEVYANWTANKTTITLDKNGATTASSPDSVTATYDSSALNPATITNPTWDGYTFYGWYKEAAGTNQIMENSTSLLFVADTDYTTGGKWDLDSSTVTLYAKWVANKTTITFDKDGGDKTAPANMVFTYNEPVTEKIPKYDGYKTGYVFKGWNVSGTDIMLYDAHDLYSYAQNNTADYIGADGKWINTSADGSTITLKAYWETITPTAITLKSTTSIGDQVIHAVYNESALQDTAGLNLPTKTGYTFMGWSTANGAGAIVINNTTVLQPSIAGFTTDDGKWNNTDAAVTLWANFTANVNTTVSFNPMGGDATPVPVNFTYDVAVPTLNSSITRTGYTFAGWNLSTGSGNWVEISDEFGIPAQNVAGYITAGLWKNKTSAIVLCANWTANTYTVTFDKNSGEGTMADQSFTYDEKKALSPNTFTKVGYNFTGWATAPTGPVVYANNSKVENLTDVNNEVVPLYANWSVAEKKDVTLNVGDNTIGETIIPLINGNNVTIDSIKGTTAGQFTFVANSGVAGVPSDPTRGYTFDGILGTFQLNLGSGAADQITLTVTFADSLNKYNESVYLKHYTTSAWDADHIPYTSKTELGVNIYEYTFPVTSYSPFSVVLESPLSTEIWLDSTSNRFAAKFNCATLVPSTPEFGNPTKVGHTFIGWYNKTDGGIKVINVTRDLVKENTPYTTSAGLWNYTAGSELTLFSNWTANVTNLKFYNTTSNVFCETNVTYGALVGQVNVPTKEGYTFGGWKVNGTSVTLFNTTGYPEKGNIYIANDGTWTADTAALKFDAIWEESSTEITLITEGWGTSMKVNVQKGTTAILPSMPANPTKAGYTFNGWKNESGVNIIGTDGALILNIPGYTESGKWSNSSSAIALYGNWTANVTNLEFYNTTSSSLFCATTVTYGMPVDPVSYPAKDGYTFGGWNYETYKLFNETGVAVSSVADYIKNGNWSKECANGTTLKLYGEWTANEITINLDPVDGITTTHDVKVFFNTSDLIGTINNPTKVGFQFNGWFNKTGGLGEKIIGTDAKLVSDVSGYTESGKWINATSPITLYANWTALKTNVTFDPKNGSVATYVDILYGADVTNVLPATSNPGYHFGGWNTSIGNVQLFNATGVPQKGNDFITSAGKWNYTLSALTLDAYWIANVSKLNLTDNGVSVKVVEATYGTSDLVNNSIATPVKTGYDFNGWFTAETGGKQVLIQNPTTVTLKENIADYTDTNGKWANSTVENGGEVKLFAQWTATTSVFDLYNAGGAGTYATEAAKATFGSAVITDKVVSLIPAKDGHTFYGWYNKTTGGVKVINETGELEADVSGYTTNDGKWNTSVSPVKLYMNLTANTTILNYYNESGVLYSDGSIVYMATVNDFAGTLPTKEHYTFNGWNVSGTTIKLWDKDGKKISPVDSYIYNSKWINDTLEDYEILNLSAEWILNKTTITLDGNGGIPVAQDVDVEYNTSTILGTINVPAKPGYWFDGWSNESDGTGVIIITNTSAFASDVYGYTDASGKWTNDTRAVTLYANWTANVTDVKYNANGGSAAGTLTDSTFTYNESAIVTQYPGYKAGYHFGGWNYTYDIYDAVKHLFNETCVAQETPGYIEGGKWVQTWANGTEMTLDAYWIANVTKLNLTLDGSSHATVNVTFGQSGFDDNRVTNPTKPGYQFLGWYNESTGGVKVVDQDGDYVTLVENVYNYTNAGKWINTSVENNGEIQLYGQWKPLVTTIYLKNSGDFFENVTARYGSSDLVPASITNPTKPGYTFRGWFNQSDASGNGFGTPVINVSYQLNYTDGYYVDAAGNWNITADTLSLYANFTANITNATFDTLGGSPVVNEYFTYNSLVKNPVNVSYKAGYWFTGWNISDADAPGWLTLFDRNAVPVVNDALQHYIVNSKWMNASLYDQQKITITAHWTPNRSILNLDAAPGSGVSPETVYATFNSTELNSSITNPTWVGHDFHGWFNQIGGLGTKVINESGLLEQNAPGYTDVNGMWINTTIADNTSITLYANWTANITQINLSKNDVLSTSTESDPVLVNATYNVSTLDPATLNDNPTKVGYTFLGWYNESVDGVKVMENSTSLTFVPNVPGYTNASGYWTYPGNNMSNITMYAHWLANETVLKLIKNNDTQTVDANPDNVTVTYDNSSIVPSTIVQATKTGYTLLGWFNESVDGVMVLDNASTPALIKNVPGYTDVDGNWKNATAFGAEIKLYAHWVANTYTVKFNANGGQGEMPVMHFVYDQAQNLAPNAYQRYNCNFLYWMYNGTRYNDTELVQNLTIIPNDEVIMVAQWQGYSTGSSNEATILNNTTIKKNSYSSGSQSTYTPSQSSFIPSSQPTYTPTVQPTAQATVVQTQAPVDVPTVPATAKPTTQPTQKSPAPVVGLLAGLGAAALFLRLRK